MSVSLSSDSAMVELCPDPLTILVFAGNTKTNKSRMSSKFDQIRQWSAELASLERLKKSFTYLRINQNILMTCWLSVELSLPFGLLVFNIVKRLGRP